MTYVSMTVGCRSGGMFGSKDIFLTDNPSGPSALSTLPCTLDVTVSLKDFRFSFRTDQRLLRLILWSLKPGIEI